MVIMKYSINILTAILFLYLFTSCADTPRGNYNPSSDSLRFAGEVHIRNIKQLTFGGNNAEAYWSFDDKKLVFQSDWDKINPHGCDQIFTMNSDGSQFPNGNAYLLGSVGKGRTTCAYYLPDGKIVYASTHAADENCPENVMFQSGRYVWPIYNSYDIYMANENGSETEMLIGSDFYDAEATVSPDGKYIIFTSNRSGDLELYRYNIATKEIVQLTDKLGYDGGAFFSRDSKMIVWRASRPEGDAATVYKELLSQGFVEPKALNIFVSDIEGKNVRQVTNLPGANWAPFFHHDGDRVLFCSNHHSIEQGGRLFDIFIINLDGTDLKQITYSGTFDAFPMFSYSGKKIVFASNRRSDRADSRETNIFVADWVETPSEVDYNFKR